MQKSWFSNFHDAIFEAHFRATITRYRYRVRFDSANKWWNLYESHISLDKAVG